MKKLELMGVQEMDAVEMIQIDGGIYEREFFRYVLPFCLGFRAGWIENKR